MNDAPTTNLFIPNVLFNTICTRHKGGGGGPCWTVESADGSLLYLGVCDQRARKAGYNAPIDPRSLQKGRTKNHGQRQRT